MTRIWVILWRRVYRRKSTFGWVKRSMTTVLAIDNGCQSNRTTHWRPLPWTDVLTEARSVLVSVGRRNFTLPKQYFWQNWKLGDVAVSLALPVRSRYSENPNWGEFTVWKNKKRRYVTYVSMFADFDSLAIWYVYVASVYVFAFFWQICVRGTGCCCCWLLLYRAILRSRADSQRSCRVWF